MANTILKSTGAILAGFAIGAILSVATDMLLIKTGIMTDKPFAANPAGIIWLVIIDRTAYNILGCYIAARLAPNRPMRHAMIIGIIGLALCIAGTIVMWDVSPRWYSLWLLVLVLPAAWAGGKLATNSSK